MRADLALALAGLVALSACTSSESCTAGEQRACTRVVDGGVTQSGYQSCGGTEEWSPCVPVGSCAGASEAYRRCETSAQCGPSGCGVCGHYAGVQNPMGFNLCYPYCQADSDCAPDSAAADVSPRCVLGQCTLLCRASSVCPRDTQCLPWADGTAAAAYPGWAGLCE